jgi:hydrogenase/urease accessory protein HupE
MKTNRCRVLFAAVLLAPTAALAHPGDHTAMTVAQVAHHIATSPDHMLEVVFAILMGVGEGWRIRRRRAAR